MPEFTSGDIQKERIAADLGQEIPNKTEKPAADAKQKTDAPDGKFSTDIDGVFADDKRGGLPVFDVETDDFFKNMKVDRKRMRFQAGSTAQKYHSNTKYRNPFWIRNKEKGLIFKVDKFHDQKIDVHDKRIR